MRTVAGMAGKAEVGGMVDEDDASGACDVEPTPGGGLWADCPDAGEVECTDEGTNDAPRGSSLTAGASNLTETGVSSLRGGDIDE